MLDFAWKSGGCDQYVGSALRTRLLEAGIGENLTGLELDVERSLGPMALNQARLAFSKLGHFLMSRVQGRPDLTQPRSAW